MLIVISTAVVSDLRFCLTMQQVLVLSEVDAAFGRKGIPSIVLEGVLGELQEATRRHLSELASGMTLELKPTTVKASSSASKRAGAKARATKAKGAAKKATRKATSKKAAAATISVDESEEQEEGAVMLDVLALGSESDEDEGELKEEIAKIIKVS